MVFELLEATKGGIVPVPDPANPILGLEFVHKKVVVPELFVVVKLTAVVDSPLHTTIGLG